MRRVVASFVLAALAGCGVAHDDPAVRTLTVFAAASLTDAFTAIASAFEGEHPGVDIVLNLAGSQQLAAQIVQGAPADVFASADPRQLEVVAEAGLLAGSPVAFAANRLTIAVEPGNPERIAGLADLARDDLTVVLPGPDVPAGRYARQALAAAGVEVAADSLETDVRAALSKVVLGEADAAIVYTSDVAAAGDDATAVPIDADVVATYPIAVLADAEHPELARRFIAFTTGTAGRRLLLDAGFEAP